MEIVFGVVYHSAVVREDIPHLDEVWRVTIKNAIERKLTTHPDVHGKPLRRSLKGYRALRVGDYRVIFRIEKRSIKILAILHRSDAYRKMDKRALSARR